MTLTNFCFFRGSKKWSSKKTTLGEGQFYQIKISKSELEANLLLGYGLPLQPYPESKNLQVFPKCVNSQGFGLLQAAANVSALGGVRLE